MGTSVLYPGKLAEPNSKIFISYARADGATLAQRLDADLRARGFDSWLDTGSIRGGDIWTRKIEEAIDSCDYFLALVSRGYGKSDTCLAELQVALDKRKPIIPLRV